MKKIKIIIMLSVIATALNSCFLFNSSEVDNSLLPVKSGEKWGYIDKKGKYIINPQFSDAGYFRDGIARVESSNYKVGYINKKGKFIIPAQYDNGTNFIEGKAFVVQPGGYPLCIDKKGNTLFSLRDAECAFGFSESMAKIAVKDKNGTLKYGFVNEKGEVVINPQYEAAMSFSEGLAAVRQKGKWGYVDKKGVMVIAPQFDNPSHFKNGLAEFNNGKQSGFIDKKGNYVIAPQFDAAWDFHNGLARIKQGEMYGYINKKGKIAINPQFEMSYDFSEGLAQFELNEKIGFIDKSSQQKIPAQFEDACDFIGNISFVQLGDKWGLIDKKGKYLVSPQFDDINQYDVISLGFHDYYYDDIMLQHGSSFHVYTQYYDASKAVASFLKTYNLTGSSFDGFNANITLQDIVDNPKYGDFADCPGDGRDSDDDDNKVVTILDNNLIRDLNVLYYDDYDDEEVMEAFAKRVSSNYLIDKDLFVIPLSICFQNQICSREDYYSSKEYAFDETMSGVIYLIFTTRGNSNGKGKSVKEEIKKQIATKANVSFKELATYEDMGLDAALSDKINFAIVNIDDDELLLFVGFDKYSQSIIKKWANNIEDFIDDIEGL